MSATAANAMADEACAASPECFICTESAPAPRKSACRCTDRHVHDACLAKMLETSKHAKCPVCAAPYANVAFQMKVVGVEPCSRGVVVLGAVVLATILLGCSTNTWLVFSKRKLSAREDFVVAFAAILMSTVGLALVAFVGHQCVCTGPTSLARSTLVRKRKVCVQPTEVAIGPLRTASTTRSVIIITTNM